MASAQPAQRRQLSLLTIPVELTLLIVDFAVEQHKTWFVRESSDDLSAVAKLSLTCKHLEEVCSRSLYRSVSLRSEAATLSFLITLERKVEVANQVRVLYFEGGCSQSQPHPHDAVAAEAIVRTDKVADGLLQAGSACVSALVAMMVLRRLPALTRLSAPEEIFEGLQYWPAEQRLEGQALSALKLTRITYRPAESPRPDYCKGWLRSFKPGQLPMLLDALEISHSCHERRPERCNIDRPSDWAAVAASVKSLTISSNPNFSSDTLTRVLKPCLRCTDLDIRDNVDDNIHHSMIPTFEWVVDSLTDCHNFDSSLSSLRIRCDLNSEEPSPGINGDAYLSLFPHFEALKKMSLPMPSEMTETALSSLAWPPNLERLELEWMLEEHDSFRTVPFPTFLINVVKAGLVPTSLRTIAISWDVNFNFGFHSEEDMDHLERILPVLEATCKSKAIVVQHTMTSFPAFPLNALLL